MAKNTKAQKQPAKTRDIKKTSNNKAKLATAKQIAAAKAKLSARTARSALKNKPAKV